MNYKNHEEARPIKTEHFIFLVLVLAAAVVVGSTMGILSNYKYISHQVKVNAQLQEAQEKQKELAKHSKATIASENESANSTQNNTSYQNSANSSNESKDSGETNTQASSTASSVKVAANDNSLMVLSQAEQQQIESMLDSVDVSKDADYGNRIRSFQEKHALSVTGILDSSTLSTLIQQAKLQKAMRNLVY